MLPNGWNKLKVINILEKVSLPVNVDPDKEYFEIGIRSHGKCIFYKEPLKGKTIGDKRVFHIESNCLILNIVFAWELAIAKTTEHERGMIASHRFPMFRPKNNMCDVDYVLYFFKTKLGKNLLGLASPGGAGRNKTLGQKEFNDLEIVLPPLPEQIKIAEILSTWDNAINTVQKLLTNSQQQKKALMQQLLTGKKRFSGFEGEWEEKRFADLYWYQEGPGVRKHQFTEFGVKLFNGTNIQNSNIDLSKTTTHIASEEAYGAYAHFLADEGDLVIACSGISVEKFDEKIAFVEKHHLPLCMNTSTMRFKTLNPQCSSIKFLRYFLSSKSFKSQIGKQATGSAQLNFGPSHVAKCKIELPNIDEQQQIATILTTADQEIDNLRAQLNHLKQEKKALMQQLLTGKRRVKVEEAA